MPTDYMVMFERYDDRKMTIAKARRIMGVISKNYSDEDMEEIIGLLYEIAELGYEDYAAHRSDRK